MAAQAAQDVHAATIILCGGPINLTSLPMGTNTSNAMIPVNGKPVIGWILNDLLDKGIDRVTVVLRKDDHTLQNFLAGAYRGRIGITQAILDFDGTILHSLQIGLHCTPHDGLVRVILGDTLIRDAYTGDSNYVYVGDVDESRRWCIVRTDEQNAIVDLIDKHSGIEPPLRALAGYYHLMDGKTFADCVDECISADQRELSRALMRYTTHYPITARPAAEWFDFGNIDHLVEARRRLLQPRHFNGLTVNPVLNTITKVSENDAKLTDELDWYLALPDDLKVLTPRIVRHERIDGRLHFVQEYYGYPTLAELWVYGNLHADTWVSILKRVFRIHDEVRRYTGEPDPAAVRSMYVDKTFERVEKLRASSPYWAHLLARETVTIDTVTYKNLPLLRDAIIARAEQLADNATSTIIHGDFCFSNILFDVNNQIIRLIDPRGSFGRKGIYGDPRYDIAKLWHSLSSGYDLITADMVTMQEVPAGSFKIRSHSIWDHTKNSQIEWAAANHAFNQLIADYGYDHTEIGFIEALLFLSMPPLHADRFDRQQIMYVKGIRLLNHALDNWVRADAQ